MPGFSKCSCDCKDSEEGGNSGDIYSCLDMIRRNDERSGEAVVMSSTIKGIIVRRSTHAAAHELMKVAKTEGENPCHMAEAIIHDCELIGDKIGMKFWGEARAYLMSASLDNDSVLWLIEDCKDIHCRTCIDSACPAKIIQIA